MKKIALLTIAFSFSVFTVSLVYSQSSENSFGAVTGDAPKNYHPKAFENIVDSRSTTNVYSFDADLYNSKFAYFDATVPGTVIPIVSHPSSPFVNACEMVAGDPTKFYAIDHAGDAFLVDAMAGTATPLGNTGLVNALGLALDYTTGVYYVCNDANNLFTIDMATLNTTLLGTFNYTGLVFMIGITCDGAGNLWGYDLGLDNFYSINKTNGQATLVGNIGFDANYGQGLGYDQANDMVVMCAWNNTSFQAEYRSVNTSTGSTTFLGAIGTSGVTQFGSCAIPADIAEVPLSNWAIAIGIIFILSAAIIRMRKFS